METKRVILARFVDFDITQTNVLSWQPDVRFSPKFFRFAAKFLENQFWQLFASIIHVLPVSNGHRAIKVHVNKV